MKKYLFKTEHFGFTENEFHLLRSRFPYKKVSFNDIIKISMIRGIRVKRPILVLIFGLLLTITALYVILFTSGLLDNLQNQSSGGSSHNGYKIFGYSFIMGGFILVFGIVAIYQSTIPTWILKTELADGATDSFSLKKLFDTNEIYKLTQFLKANFSSIKIDIDKRIA